MDQAQTIKQLQYQLQLRTQQLQYVQQLNQQLRQQLAWQSYTAADFKQWQDALQTEKVAFASYRATTGLDYITATQFLNQRLAELNLLDADALTDESEVPPPTELDQAL